MYDPRPGRWLSEDPAELLAGDPNVYRYVSNSAADTLDPAGLWGRPFHVDDTLRLCRLAGIPEETARKIATWAFWPDANPKTDPIEVAKYLVWALECGTEEERSEAFRRLDQANWLHFPLDADGVVRPGSDRAKETVQEGAKTGELQYFAVGLHVLQDSHSHQGTPYLRGMIGHGRGVVQNSRWTVTCFNLLDWMVFVFQKTE